MEPKVGDVYRRDRTGTQFEVIAINHSNDNVAQYWVRNLGTGEALTHHRSALSGLVKVKPFFEEKKTYAAIGSITFRKVTIWHVHDLPGGKVAVGQWTTGEPVLLLESDLQCLREV